MSITRVLASAVHILAWEPWYVMVRDKACIRFFLEACCELWWGSLCLLVTLQAALTPVTDKQIPLYRDTPLYTDTPL